MMKRVSQDEIGFWIAKNPGECWICGSSTKWVLLDIGYQHPDCDSWPEAWGNVVVKRGQMTIYFRTDDHDNHPRDFPNPQDYFGGTFLMCSCGRIYRRVLDYVSKEVWTRTSKIRWYFTTREWI